MQSRSQAGLFYFCTMKRIFTLGKKERLKSRKQIEQLFSKGKKFVVAPFRIHYLSSDHLTTHLPVAIGTPLTIQFGAGVSAKNFKRAVDRKRIKRLIREAWRLQNTGLKEKLKLSGNQLNVFFIYTAKELPDFNLIKNKVAVALKKLSDKIDENGSSNS